MGYRTPKNPPCEKCGNPVNKKKGYLRWTAYSHIECPIESEARERALPSGKEKPKE